MIRKWNQTMIHSWANQNFGEISALAKAIRANKEMSELITALDSGEIDEARKEVCDVVIVLMQVAHDLGIDLVQGIDEKMDINEKRQWERKPDGSFGHV